MERLSILFGKGSIGFFFLTFLLFIVDSIFKLGIMNSGICDNSWIFIISLAVIGFLFKIISILK